MSKSETIKTLRAARYLIEKPEAWIKKYYRAYRTLAGRVIENPSSFNCYCLAGAIEDASGYESYEAYEAIRKVIGAEELPDDGPPEDDSDIVRWNDADGRTHSEVVSVLDKAIAIIEKDGK